MKIRVIVTVIAALAAALLYATTAGAPNRPPPSDCPAGYERDSGSSDRQLLCTRTVTRDVVREVPVVRVEYRDTEVIKEVPGPERIVEKLVEVPVDRVVTRTVVKFKTKIKRVVQWKTKIEKVVVLKKYCPKKPNGDDLSG